MNTAALRALAPLGSVRTVGATLIAWWDAIRSVRSKTWLRAGLIVLFGTVLECALLLGERRLSIPAPALIPNFVQIVICWVVQVALGLCAWAIVDKSSVAMERRVRWLVVALLAATVLQALLVPALTGLAIGQVDPCVLHGCEGKDWSKIPGWLMNVSDDGGHMLMFGSLAFAWLEANRRNREIERRLLASQQERARLTRSAFDARLTAMRAQVDPQFLFDSLADVQSFYAIEAGRGAATLDLLITYLRTALPRLRTEGSTIGAEAELVAAWLAVIAARRNGLPTRRFEVDPACSNRSFPATVLLPLVQWAVGDAGQSACDVSLQVRPLREDGAAQLLVQLRVAPGRPCSGDEPELRRIRERLQALSGETADLSCAWRPVHDELNGGRSAPAAVISLRWPDESPDRDRR